MASQGKARGIIFWILVIMAGLGTGWIMLGNGGSSTQTNSYPSVATPSDEERSEAGKEAFESIAQEADWPETPADLIRDFWKAANQKDWTRLTVLCPGSTAGEFKGYYDQFTPSPAKGIGTPQPHPDHPDTKLFPVKVAFPGFPNKTIKMAVGKSPDGRWVIQGGRTIWW